MSFHYDLNRLEVMLLAAALESLAVYAKRAPEEVQQYIVGLLLEGHCEIPYEELVKHIDALQAKLAAGVPNDQQDTDPRQELPILPENAAVGEDASTGPTTPEPSDPATDMPPQQAQ